MVFGLTKKINAYFHIYVESGNGVIALIVSLFFHLIL